MRKPKAPPVHKPDVHVTFAGQGAGLARAVVIWLTAMALGALLVAVLPENWFGGGALFRFSDRHGPSAADAVGLVVVFAGWLVYLHALWSRRRNLKPRWAAIALAGGAAAALVGCIAAFAADKDGWGYALGATALAAQLALCLTARGKRL